MLSPSADIAAVFSPFRFSVSPIVAAVSGGSDSTALLVLLKTFLDRRPSAPRLVAVTVDHDLRAGSLAEAGAVAALAARLGVEHRIVKWEGEKPATGRAAAARMARYGLLSNVAQQIGATMILTGHTADDQAETVAMRRIRGTGLGLAGMAPATLFDGRVWITRPLLETLRKDLRDILRRQQIEWADDPSNDDRRSERVRMRSALSDNCDRDAAITRLLSMAGDAAFERKALGSRAAQLIESHARQRAPGLFHLEPGFRRAPEPETVHALRILLAVVGGRDQLPKEDRVVGLLSKLAGQPHRATLSRAMISSRRDGVWICRETRGLPQPQPVTDAMVWDGRYRLTGLVGKDWSVSAEIEDLALEYANPLLPSSLARAAKSAQPAFVRRANCKAEDEGRDQRSQNDIRSTHRFASDLNKHFIPILAPWATFLPSFDLALARAMAQLIGAEPISDPPLADHNVAPA